MAVNINKRFPIKNPFSFLKPTPYIVFISWKQKKIKGGKIRNNSMFVVVEKIYWKAQILNFNIGFQAETQRKPSE